MCSRMKIYLPQRDGYIIAYNYYFTIFGGALRTKSELPLASKSIDERSNFVELYFLIYFVQ